MKRIDLVLVLLISIAIIIAVCDVLLFSSMIDEKYIFIQKLKSTEQQLSYCQQDMDNKMMEVEFTWFMPDECEWALLTEECFCE